MMQISKSSPNHSNRQAPNQTFKGGKIYFVDKMNIQNARMI